MQFLNPSTNKIPWSLSTCKPWKIHGLIPTKHTKLFQGLKAEHSNVLHPFSQGLFRKFNCLQSLVAEIHPLIAARSTKTYQNFKHVTIQIN